MNKFLTDNYDKIIIMAKRICKGSHESEDVAHHAIESFLVHKRAQEIVDANEGMKFMSGIIWRSFHSSTSPYHKLYRQSGKVYSLYADTAARLHEVAHEEYDMEQDLTVESIQGILEDMLSDTVEQWFRATLFNMWLQESNYSELARLTGIPRTSISQAVQECKAYIKKRIDNGTTT
jgi:DNA-directed RNA polymerase specialized sigma24 family protein